MQAVDFWGNLTLMPSMNLNALLDALPALEVLYVIASLVVAVLIWVEASLLHKNQGKFPTTRLFAVVSLITSSWLLVSGVALYFLEFEGIAKAVPVVYGIYSVMGWIYGARLMEVPDDPRDLVVPDKYLSYSKSFSLVFTGLCVATLVFVHRTQNLL